MCCWITNITIYTDSSTIGWIFTDGKNPSEGRRKADKINRKGAGMLQL